MTSLSRSTDIVYFMRRTGCKGTLLCKLDETFRDYIESDTSPPSSITFSILMKPFAALCLVLILDSILGSIPSLVFVPT